MVCRYVRKENGKNKNKKEKKEEEELKMSFHTLCGKYVMFCLSCTFNAWWRGSKREHFDVKL